MEKISKNVEKNVRHIKKTLGNSADVVIKKLKFKKVSKVIYVIYSSALVDDIKQNEFIFQKLGNKLSENRIIASANIVNKIEEIIPNVENQEISRFEDLFEKLYSGETIILVDGIGYAFASDTVVELDRGVSEATTEIVVRGPKDAFTENFNKNVGLVRKRIKSPKLWLEQLYIGRKTKTKVGIMYMEDIVDLNLVKKARKKLKNIDIDGIIDSGYIRDLMNKESKTIFPTLYCSERPDTSSIALLNGKLIIMVDNSPFVLIAPTFFMDFLHSPEDYYQKPLNATFVRLVRVVAFFVSLLLPAYYVSLATFNHEAIPPSLLINFATQREGVPFPLIVEVIFLAAVFEILREADIRLPSAIGTSISIVGALVLGEAAVQAGIVSTITVIVVALTAIASLNLPSIEFSNSVKIWRIILMVFAATFGNIGIMIGILILILHLSSIKTFGVPYLSPFSPFSLSDMKDNVMRFSIKKFIKRPSPINKKNPIRQRVGDDM